MSRSPPHTPLSNSRSCLSLLCYYEPSRAIYTARVRLSFEFAASLATTVLQSCQPARWVFPQKLRSGSRHFVAGSAQSAKFDGQQAPPISRTLLVYRVLEPLFVCVCACKRVRKGGYHFFRNMRGCFRRGYCDFLFTPIYRLKGDKPESGPQ